MPGPPTSYCPPPASGGITVGLLAFLVVLLPAAAPAESAVYRCDGPGGPGFSDRPCGPDAQEVHIRDNHIGGSFADNLPAFEPPPAPEEGARKNDEPDTCRFINSTSLRTYLARNQVVPGMTREQVQQAFGRTSEVYPVPQETWVYQTKYYGALYELTYVYFRNECVERVEYRKP